MYIHRLIAWNVIQFVILSQSSAQRKFCSKFCLCVRDIFAETASISVSDGRLNVDVTIQKRCWNYARYCVRTSTKVDITFHVVVPTLNIIEIVKCDNFSKTCTSSMTYTQIRGEETSPPVATINVLCNGGGNNCDGCRMIRRTVAFNRKEQQIQKQIRYPTVTTEFNEIDPLLSDITSKGAIYYTLIAITLIAMLSILVFCVCIVNRRKNRQHMTRAIISEDMNEQSRPDDEISMTPLIKNIFVLTYMSQEKEALDRIFVKELQKQISPDRVLIHVINPDTDMTANIRTEIQRSNAIFLVFTKEFLDIVLENAFNVTSTRMSTRERYIDILNFTQNYCSDKIFFTVLLEEGLERCEEFLCRWNVFNKSVVFDFSDMETVSCLQRCRHFSSFLECLHSYNF